MKIIKQTIFLEKSETEDLDLDIDTYCYPVYITEDDEILFPWNGFWLQLREVPGIQRYHIEKLRKYLGLDYIEEGF